MSEEIYISPICKEIKAPASDIELHDTTLREGEQTPGVVYNIEDKLRIAEMLLDIGIDRIESGFPASSETEKKAVSRIVKDLGSKHIFGFARAVKRDIEQVIDCGCEGILISFPPSDIHLQYKLRITRQEYLERAIEMVEFAKSHGLKIVYSAEDATRAEYNWLLQVFKTVQDVGADVCRIADTLGCITPTAMGILVSRLKRDGIKKIEVHCHNDYGLALANSLSAFESGADAISTSVLGIGERAGIAATEEVILDLYVFYGIRKYKIGKLTELCRLVSELSGFKPWPTKPVVGDNVFVHYSGIHQDGVLKRAMVYESYPPELVGGRRKILLGKVSGRAAVKAKLLELGVNVDDQKLLVITNKVKEISVNRKSAITDEEFIEILRKEFGIEVKKG